MLLVALAEERDSRLAWDWCVLEHSDVATATDQAAFDVTLLGR
jgi:hypothetical protein